MKKKNLLLTFLLAALVFGGVKAQTTVTIGDGTGKSYQAPINLQNRFCFTEMIYQASDINQSENKTITAIAFNYELANHYGESYTVDIYMKNTDKSSFVITSGTNSNDWVPMNTSDKVFSGTMTLPNSAGWFTITLDTPFEYDHTKNLVIAVNKTIQSGFSTWSGGFNTTSSNAYYTLYVNGASTAYDPSTIAANGSPQNLYPNITITFKDESPLPVYPIPANLTASPIKTYEATLTWDEPENAISYNVKFHETSSSEWTTETGLATNTLLLSNLDANTAYEAQVQAVYSESNSDWSSVYSFTTLNLLRYTSTASYQSWHSTSAWTPSEVPTANHDVVIEKPAKISAGNAFANNITINTEATLDIQSSLQSSLQSSRTLYCNQITNNGALIIEDGAQLICNNNVAATVQKSITPFTGANDPGHWYLIASPMTDEFTISTETNLTTDPATNYDLYLFDQTNDGYEWRNYKNENPYFSTIKNKVGYLYANATNNFQVEFTGTLNNTDGEVLLTNTPGHVRTGVNLIGNPYPCNTTITDNNNQALSFYRIIENNGVSELQPASGVVYPMEGVVVEASSVITKAIFTKATSQNATGNNNNIQAVSMSLSQDRSTLDRAAVRFDEGNTLGKMMLNPDNTRIYLTVDDKDYAVAHGNAQGEMPVNFKAAEDGQYTITVNPENVEMSYLHLIDNMTGANIDLLNNPSYTFNANANDYSSRFRLVFSVNGIDENTQEDQTFAFVSNGQINITTDASDATVQVIDMMGRIIARYNGVNAIPTTGMAQGIYIIRMTDGNNVRNQKIIIK